MSKILFNGLEEGGVYQMRTSEFIPIQNFKKILLDFDKMYESYQNAPSLFRVNGSDSIVVIADTHKLNISVDGIDFYDYDVFQENIERLKQHLNQSEISTESTEILVKMIENEDLSVSSIIEHIAQPGQSINIECTDTLYGNGSFMLTV